MVDLREIHSLSDFQRNTREHMTRMKANKKPVVLTVNGKAELVVQDAEAYQEMLDRIERIETVAALRESQAELDRGDGIDAFEALEALRIKLGVPDRYLPVRGK
jgi:PHD/YefM family antitoxin component YafN of YafNO toxin-antitoxin module